MNPAQRINQHTLVTDKLKKRHMPIAVIKIILKQSWKMYFIGISEGDAQDLYIFVTI